MYDDFYAKLLVVDDEPSILRSIKRQLRPKGYHIYMANNAFEGLQIAKAEEIDVIISDMRMPEVDGAEFLKQTNEINPSIRKILLTGYADIESLIKAINQGNIDRYIQKPWDPEELESAIEQLLELKQLCEKNQILTKKLVVKNQELTTLNNELEQRVQQRTELLQRSYNSIKSYYSSSVELISSLLAKFDPLQNECCIEISALAKKMAMKLNMNDAEIQSVYFASLLSKVGLIGFSENLLNKSFESMTVSEKVEYKKYPLLGEMTLVSLKPLSKIAKIIGQHKENCDGSGYPQKLTGDKISLSAKILHIATDYYELIAGTLLNQALSSDEAIIYLKTHKNTYYDKQCVEVIESCIEKVLKQTPSIDMQVTENDLQPGMILAKPMFSKGGIKLLSKNHILTEENIRKIQQLNGLDIIIYRSM